VNRKTVNPKTEGRPGFTLLELMVAMVILTIAMSIAFEAFSGTIRAWKRGTEVVDGIKHGDFAMNQLAAALNSTLYFFNERKSYAFTIEKDNSACRPTRLALSRPAARSCRRDRLSSTARTASSFSSTTRTAAPPCLLPPCPPLPTPRTRNQNTTKSPCWFPAPSRDWKS
jgi:prepilin-type N-terminal cleavage/methylation domain-containing protein